MNNMSARVITKPFSLPHPWMLRVAKRSHDVTIFFFYLLRPLNTGRCVKVAKLNDPMLFIHHPIDYFTLSSPIMTVRCDHAPTPYTDYITFRLHSARILTDINNQRQYTRPGTLQRRRRRRGSLSHLYSIVP